MYGSQENPLGSPVPRVPFEQPKSLFRFGETSLWSSQMHAQNAVLANASFRLFATPRGQVGQGFTNALTIAETSLKEGGRVPSGVAYDVFAVACQFSITNNINDTGSNGVSLDTAAQINQLLNLQNNGVLSWD